MFYYASGIRFKRTAWVAWWHRHLDSIHDDSKKSTQKMAHLHNTHTHTIDNTTDKPKKKRHPMSQVVLVILVNLSPKARKGLPEGYMILGQFQQSQQGLGLWHIASETDARRVFGDHLRRKSAIHEDIYFILLMVQNSEIRQTSWYGTYPIIYQGFIHVRWWRISSINSMEYCNILFIQKSRMGIPPEVHFSGWKHRNHFISKS